MSIPHQWAWIASALCIFVVGVIASLLFNEPTTHTVLARTIDALAIESGQIVHQIYTSHDGLYQEWQLMGVTPQDRIIAIERTIIRYSENDTEFTQPEEWFYITSEKRCNLSHVKIGIRYPEPDEDGCFPLDNTDQTSDPLAPFPGEDLRQRLERLQTDSGNVIFEETTFDQRTVYRLTYAEINPQPNLRVFTSTLYIDAVTYLPAGYAYALAPHNGRIYEWQTTIVVYEILDPTDLTFDPFIWPPPKNTQP